MTGLREENGIYRRIKKVSHDLFHSQRCNASLGTPLMWAPLHPKPLPSFYRHNPSDSHFTSLSPVVHTKFTNGNAHLYPSSVTSHSSVRPPILINFPSPLTSDFFSVLGLTNSPTSTISLLTILHPYSASVLSPHPSLFFPGLRRSFSSLCPRDMS